MSKSEPLRKRDAISRARFFLAQARECQYRGDVAELQPFESYLEAALVFGRVAIHRVYEAANKKAQGNPNLTKEVKERWSSLRGVPAVEFFRVERNFISKVGPPKVSQIVGLDPAEERYYYEDPQTPVTTTVERQLDSVEEIVVGAEKRFRTLTLLGQWD